MFSYLDLETSSMCNRTCYTCIRNSHPNEKKVASFFETNLLPMDVIVEAFDQGARMGFTGSICLSHYNEPLLDPRLPDIVRLAKSYPQFESVFFNSNGDLLTPELAAELDGALDKVIVSLYMKEPMKSERAELLSSYFHKTEAQMNTVSDHIATHFSPGFDVAALAEENKFYPCREPQMRVVINHRRQFLLCCDDVVGNFDLGTFPETSIKDYWFGKKHSTIVKHLDGNCGRLRYKYCRTCPRK